MKYTGYKLEFSSAVHLGNGSPEDTGFSLYADTLFSAMCIEAVNLGILDNLVEAVKQAKIRISDAFPYWDNKLYIPKPMVAIEGNGSSKIKKSAKKLEYIPANEIDTFLAGRMDVEGEAGKIGQIGKAEIRTMASVSGEEQTRPFSLGTYRFSDNWGLYFIVGYEDEDSLYVVDDVINALEYSGIGGKRSIGLGRFKARNFPLPGSLQDAINNAKACEHVMTLSISMCGPDELDGACAEGNFSIIKRSGYVYSNTYAASPMKKRDMYCFKSGSVFKGTFDGVLADVSISGNHPVYRYAIPMFMGVRKNG